MSGPRDATSCAAAGEGAASLACSGSSIASACCAPCSSWKARAERAIAAGWKTSGKTPHATLYAAMLREIAKKGDAARFRKADRGLFEAGASAKPNTNKGA